MILQTVGGSDMWLGYLILALLFVGGLFAYMRIRSKRLSSR